MNNYFAAIVAIIGALLLPGCRGLDPAGIYKGDQVLYNAHKTINDAYDILHDFVKWELDNREVLAKWPEIRQAANNVRRNAQNWIESASNLVDAYEKDPSPPQLDRMQQALQVLRQAISEAARFKSEANKKPE